MPSKIRTEDDVVLRFGGGINSRASEEQIDPLECTEGQNFRLDPGNAEFRPRAPFDLVGTTPNAAEIRGLITLLKSDGTVKMAVQSGANVYDWDGTVFTLIGTVSATAKLRGTIESNWPLDDKVIITDINLAQNVQEWNGTTFQAPTFLASDGSTGFGNFKAKYCVVENERAIFGNIDDNGTAIPHLLVGSQRGQFEVIIAAGQQAADRAQASGISAEDPWFIPMPQFKPINGLASAYGVFAISQAEGAFELLSGNDATDFNLDKLHDGSGANGNESVISTGNDVIYGAPGLIESLASTERFGDVEIDDLSFLIQPDITTYKTWTLVYNSRVKRVYCFPDGKAECWVLYLDLIGSNLSPWSKWVTSHGLQFQPTAVMTCRDPTDGLKYVFMGDSAGNLYRMEGSGLLGDGATHSIKVNRTSGLFAAPADLKLFNIEGFLEHRKKLANTAALTLLFSGEHAFNQNLQRDFAVLSLETPYGGLVYYGGDFYYGIPQQDRLIRRTFAAAGQSNQFQLKTEIEGVNDFAVTKVGFRFEEAS